MVHQGVQRWSAAMAVALLVQVRGSVRSTRLICVPVTVRRCKRCML